MFVHVSWFTDFLTSVDKQSSGRVENITLVDSRTIQTKWTQLNPRLSSSWGLNQKSITKVNAVKTSCDMPVVCCVWREPVYSSLHS